VPIKGMQAAQSERTLCPRHRVRALPRNLPARLTRIGYLAIDWPTEGRGRLEEFLGQILPTL
jgi:hypothetical protein